MRWNQSTVLQFLILYFELKSHKHVGTTESSKPFQMRSSVSLVNVQMWAVELLNVAAILLQGVLCFCMLRSGSAGNVSTQLWNTVDQTESDVPYFQTGTLLHIFWHLSLNIQGTLKSKMCSLFINAWNTAQLWKTGIIWKIFLALDLYSTLKLS